MSSRAWAGQARAAEWQPVVARRLGGDAAQHAIDAAGDRIQFGSNDAPLRFVRSWYRADLYEYTVTFEGGDQTQQDQYA